MKKILILVDWYLPGYKAGGPIQSTSNLVAALSDTYTFAVITLNTDLGDPTPYPAIPTNTWFTRPEGTRVYYFSKDQLTIHRLRELILAENADFIYLNSMFSVPFTIWPWWLMLRREIPGRLVLAPRGMLQAGAVQIKWLKKRVFLTLLAMTGGQRKLTWHATDEQERIDIQQFFGKKVDVRVSSNIPKQFQLPHQPIPKTTGKVRFVFASRISKKKNVDFFLRQLRYVRGEVLLDIVGPLEDPEYVKVCEKEIAKLPENIQAQFIGPIPAPELPQKLGQYHFSVLSTTAENFGHAIFEGLLAGLPVLISDRTPWRDLTSKCIGWDTPLETPEQWVQAIQTAIDMDQSTYERWSQAAWQFAAAYKSDPALLVQTKQLFS